MIGKRILLHSVACVANMNAVHLVWLVANLLLAFAQEAAISVTRALEHWKYM